MCREKALRLCAAAAAVICFVVGLLCLTARQAIPQTDCMPVRHMQSVAWAAMALLLTVVTMEFLLSHRIYKGLHYFWLHFTILRSLESQMVDAGLCIDRGNWKELPHLSLSFSKGFSTGVLKVQNSLKFDSKLDSIVMSAALGRFAVERHYQSDDGNLHIFEMIDAETSYKKEFQKYNTAVPEYKIFLDKRSQVRLQHMLLVGQTGSGKTYALYGFILQMLNKTIDGRLYFADPKGSSLAVIGEKLSPERTAVSMDEIISLLETFVSNMRTRKAKMKELLQTRLDADYSYFGLSPHVFICDEYASVASVLNSLEKKTRDRVKSLLHEVILQGRQLGFFLFIVMQKSDATLIDTLMRDNIPIKIVLGNAEQQTYVTAFGTGVEIPNRHYAVGEGVFTEPTLAPQPKLVQSALLDFDILEACNRAWVM